MSTESRHLSVFIESSVPEVCAFVSNPANLTRWAPGLGSDPVQIDGAWFVDTPQGRVRVTFAPANDFGVLDHDVVLPGGDTVHVPMRALPDGTGSEVVFTVRRAQGMTDADFDLDAATVAKDLELLKQVLEGPGG